MIKKIVAALAAAAMLIHVLPTGLAQADYEYVYVSVDGSDITGDGTVQNPVASLTGAKNIVAEYLLEGKNARVKIHAGVYPVEKIRFTQADSGTEEYPVIYEAYGDGEVVFSGAKSLEIGEFEKVSDPNVLLKLPQNARGKVLSYNLEETGIYCSAYSTYHNYLYVNGKEQVQARYPNYGYLTEDDITVSGATTLTFSDERISRWKAADDAILAGSVGGSYFWGWKKIKNISGNIMTLDNNISTSYVRMYVRNILEEIDMPGEYFVDRRNNMLYYYPVDNVEKMSITSYVGTDSLITMNGTSNVTLRGLTFEKTGGNQVIYAEDVKNVNITGCNFNYCQGNYVLYLKGSDCTVSDNTVYGCDGGFVSFEGGTLSTLEAGNIVFENNSITSCGRHYQYINAVFSGGDNSPTSKSVSIGNVIRNNIIGDCTTTYAITVPGNNNLIEGNEIYNQGKHIRDGGAVYFGRSNSKYGNSVVNNYFHDFAEDVYSAVYSDDGYGGLRVENNVIKNVYEGIKAGMGMNNIFNNNLLINCNRGLRLQTRMFSVDHDTFGNNGALYQETVRVLNNYETFSKTYGDLITGSIERKPFFAPWNSSVTGNVLIGDGKLIYSTPVHYYYQNGVNTDSILTISGEDEVEGIDDAVYENPNNNMMYVNEMELYGKKITDENGDNLNATEKGNRSYGYSDSYFENAESQDYTPSATLLDIENSLSGINISKTGIISSQNADAFEYDESVELVYPKNFQKIFRNQCEFKWSEVKNASKYLLIVSENEDLTNPVIHEEITENGMGYITDLGMTGPIYSVLGMERSIVIDKFLTGMPNRFEVADGKAKISGCIFEVDEETGKTTDVKRIIIQ